MKEEAEVPFYYYYYNFVEVAVAVGHNQLLEEVKVDVEEVEEVHYHIDQMVNHQQEEVVQYWNDLLVEQQL